MLIDIFTGSGPIGQKITIALLVMLTTLISLTVHEVSHGYAALKCGDPTARNFGRLTLDPTKHLDPIGTIAHASIRVWMGKTRSGKLAVLQKTPP